jgi:c-di-GMP-related signal transduction protein
VSSVLPMPAAQDAADRSAALRFMARQPILNLRGEVHAYELLFRSGRENVFSGDVEVASRTIVDDAVLFGLEELTGGLPAFVNCTAQVLTMELAGVLPPHRTILEVLETVEPSSDIVAACRRLKAMGYRIALDDFVWEPRFDPLVQIADFIKVDFLLSDASARRDLFRRLRGRRATLLAEKVETQEQFRQARDEGFTLFQGYYFCRPVVMEKRKIPANRHAHFKILELLHSDPVDFRELTPLVKSDAALAHRLLRLVNSAGYEVRNDVRSLQSALVIVGEDNFRRIATLAIASELNTGRPAEILRMALVRARFCELAAAHFGLDPTEQYLLGLLSLWPAMLQTPMEELTPLLPLPATMCASLNGVLNSERRLLTWIEFHERADWESCDVIARAEGLNRDLLLRAYADAVLWAAVSLRSAS